MRGKLAAAVALGTTAMVALTSAIGQASNRDADLLANAAWLTGCWEARTGSRLIEEQWDASAREYDAGNGAYDAGRPTRCSSLKTSPTISRSA